MIIKLSMVVFLCFCCSLVTVGQIEDYQTSKVIPASPTSAALGKYGEVPVSLMNGSPSIGIPLYEIRTPGHSLNVSLNYDASGTKVNQDASWVGLGWSLFAGGAITRTIMQKDDLNSMDRGYTYWYSLPDSINWSTRESYFDDAYKGVIDVEPDVFSYNFCGKAGRFVMGKSADGYPVFVDKMNDLSISYVLGDWVVIDGLGYKYYFSTKEISENYYVSGEQVITNFSGLTYSTGLGWNNLTADAYQTVSAWYLDSVVAQTGETLKFTYTASGSLSTVNQSESYYKTFSHDPGNCSSLSEFPLDLVQSSTRSYSRQQVFNRHIGKIEFVNGSIEFKVSDRLDMEPSTIPGTTNPSKLDSIIIKDDAGVIVKMFRFFYGYFNSSNIHGRLKLDSIVEIGKTGESLLPYEFTYYNPNSLPDKSSKSVDHWGYYNGFPNQSILTYNFLINEFGKYEATTPYGNRNANELVNYPINGVLSKIVYPTGGHTNFEYEPNDFGNLSGDMAYNTVNKDTAAFNNPSNTSIEPYKVVEFTIPAIEGVSELSVDIENTYQNVANTNLPDSGSTGPVYALFQQIDNSGNVLDTKFSRTTDEIHELSGLEHIGVMVVPGKYRLTVLSSAIWYYHLNVSWVQRDSVSYRKGGGIRIKSIRNNDGFGQETVKKYSYKNSLGETSGILFHTPQYDARLLVKARAADFNLPPCKYSMDLYTVRASNIFPSGLSSISGTVGYKQVTESDGENGENGKTVYYYDCNPESNNTDFPGIPNISLWSNGILDSVLVFNNLGILVKRTDYSLSVKETQWLTGLKLYSLPTGLVPEPGAYEAIFYNEYSYWVTPEVETETLYSGNNAITTTKKFYYDNANHRQLTRERAVNSVGDTLITKYKRPDDYSVTGGNPFVEQMRDLHIISPVIEQQTLVKQGATTKLVGGAFASFSKINDKYFKPSVIYRMESQTPVTDTTESSFLSTGESVLHSNYQASSFFNSYNNLGNLTNANRVNDVSESILYGYKNSLPIAVVKDALLKDIFHTSFEEGDGNSSDGDSKTGRKSKTGGFSDTLTGLTSGLYTLSYWSKPASVWVYNQSVVTVSGSSYIINLSGQLDEIRFYPVNAQMTTFTFDPLVGMTSQCDANSTVAYYQYDSFNRLKSVRDQDGNLVKALDYQLQKPYNQ